MESRCHLRTKHLVCLILVCAFILDSSPLKIPLEKSETNQQMEHDINKVLHVIERHFQIFGSQSIIVYPGNIDLRPSLEQRLMETLTIPIYTVRSNKGPLNRRYPQTETLVIVMFSGMDDPALGAVNDTGLAYSDKYTFAFFCTNPLSLEMIREIFNWCWKRKFIRSFVLLHGESEFEIWAYYKQEKLIAGKIINAESLITTFRSFGYKFLVQVANDVPSIFWYNSSEKADVIGGGNISLSGAIGILIMEFMRYINATMEILPVPISQNSNYEFLKVGSNRTVDMVANLVINDSNHFDPVVSVTQACLLVPRYRTIPISRYFDKVIVPNTYHIMLATILLLVVTKYIAHRRRSLVDSFLGSFRFVFGIPLPGGQLARLPLADKIIEVYCFLWMGILISTCGSLLSSILTTGIHYPPITDVESMRASGLRIITSDPTIPKAFKDNEMPSSLSDLVDVVDKQVVIRNSIYPNDNVVFVPQTHNWQGFRFYQDHLKTKGYTIAGPKLCSKLRHLRLPTSPYSPLKYFFRDYFSMIFESGLQQKWLKMGFQKFREIYGITKLPFDSEKEFKPLTLSFYMIFIKIYIGGMLLSTLVFVIEILYKRYHG
ncbi:hypothetical protein KR032_009511 [Drosophila birchii]|nr:hypothetical protein KR032_009511 [Drosophila birchii]